MPAVIRIQPEPTAAANAGTSAVAAQMAAGTNPAEALCVAPDLAHAASMWAESPMMDSLSITQSTHVSATVSLRTGEVAATNEQALDTILTTDDQNAQSLTSHPSEVAV